MHILVSNDDGPPSDHSSPYVLCWVRALQQAGHTVSVCLPSSQRSWIGKAHLYGQTLTPTYYTPPEDVFGGVEGTVSKLPSRDGGGDEWILLDGTPASTVQVGLHHCFARRGPVDLVLSGPNFGRNATACFALSSGTLGAALEAATCGVKSVAVSFAFFDKDSTHDPALIQEACKHGVRIVEALVRDWPAGGSVDLYTVNVPLQEGVSGKKVVFAEMLQNYWGKNVCTYKAIEPRSRDDDVDTDLEEEKIRAEGEASARSRDDGQTPPEDKNDNEPKEGYGQVKNKPKQDPKEEATEEDKDKYGQIKDKKTIVHRHFKWAPELSDVYRSVAESKPGNDGWAVAAGFTSVTPLKANFWHAAQHLNGKELQL
jgi:tubulin--tyrosine ligase